MTTTSDPQVQSSVSPIVESDIESTHIEPPQPFQLRLILRLSTFQIGSAMGDILTTSVWNRIMISDFGIPAWPVGLLIALRYFMAPVSLWVGNRSDTKPLFGQYRTSYIWLGRGLMLIAFLLLGFSTVQLENNTGNTRGWATAVLTFLMYGLGTLLSGSPFLALVRDSAPREKQGIAIGIVETVLIAMFPVVAIGFSRMLTSYDPSMFWRLILFVTVVAGFFWFFGVVGVEKRNRAFKPTRRVKQTDLRMTFQKIWGDDRTRRFFVFLFIATFAAWMQDNILEPFGADVFDMVVEETTRLTGYWGTATILVLLASFYIWRKKRPEEQAGVAGVGLAIMGLGMVLLAGSAFAGQERLFLAALVIFGAGFGLYTFGGLSLMAAMSPDPNAGAYLGLWTVAILVSKGLGTFMGGVSRDVVLFLSENDFSLAYGLTFLIAGLGLWTAVVVLRAINVPAFVRETAANVA